MWPDCLCFPPKNPYIPQNFDVKAKSNICSDGRSNGADAEEMHLQQSNKDDGGKASDNGPPGNYTISLESGTAGDGGTQRSANKTNTVPFTVVPELICDEPGQFHACRLGSTIGTDCCFITSAVLIALCVEF